MTKQKALLVRSSTIKKHPCRAYGFLWSRPDFAMIAAGSRASPVSYIVIPATPRHMGRLHALERLGYDGQTLNIQRKPASYGNWIRAENFRSTDAIAVSNRKEPTAIYVAARHMKTFGLRPDLKYYELVDCADGQTFTKCDDGTYEIAGVPASDFARAARRTAPYNVMATLFNGHRTKVIRGDDALAIRRLFEMSAQMGKKPHEILDEYEASHQTASPS